MSPQDLFAAFDLPAACQVGQRIPKKLLVENGAPTAADKRKINEGIEEIQWLAALKPTTIGGPEFRHEAHEYLEIVLLHIVFRPAVGSAQNRARLVELVHRAIPYPLLLLASSDSDPRIALSLAHKRWAQNEAGKVVLEDGIVEVAVGGEADADGAVQTPFIAALAPGKQPRAHLHALYQGWIDTLQALLAAQLTGTFVPASSTEQAARRRMALHEMQRLGVAMADLRKAATKEKQLARRVELNLELQRLQRDLNAAQQQL